MWFKIPAVRISPDLLAGIVVGVGVFLVILIVLCICLCCRRKNGKSRKGADAISVENPPEAQGNHEGVPAQPRQQQNRPPRKAKFIVVPDPSPSLAPAAAAAAAAATPLQRQASMSSTAGSSLAPPKHLRRESSFSPPSSIVSIGSSQIMFTYEELAMATNGFSKANVLGQGGFGFVHKGYLPNGKEVAVKSLNDNSEQGEREFKAEVETISRVHHRHLVSLVGYCVTGSRRLLVYEFVPNKTLEFHLHGKGQPSMDWPTRMKVALGTAKGLAYLHEDCYPRIIHRDIKAANILLDDNFQAKVADFGLAKFASEADTHVSTRVMGTLGYLAPEYASSGKLTEKSDVYSFGVILLELITGHIPIDRTHKENILVEWARPLFAAAIEREDFKYLVDSRLQDCYKRDEMARMVSCAATCVRKSSRRRPLMSQVIRALEGNISISEIDNGITPGRSMVNRFDASDSEFNGSSQYNEKGTSKGFQTSSSDYSGSQYKGEPRALDSEHDRTSSEEYGGLSPSSSTCEGHTVRELDTEEVKREIARFKLHRIRP